MRVPLPAAGTMPHIATIPPTVTAASRALQAACSSVSGEHPLPCRGADPRQLGITALERCQYIIGRPSDDDLALRREELVEALPPIADDRRAAGGRLEQAP